MKSKVFSKKLSLNKETIADLKTDKMGKIYGGGENHEPATPPIGCTYTCAYTCPITCGICPTDCTCGTGNPVCPCASRGEL